MFFHQLITLSLLSFIITNAMNVDYSCVSDQPFRQTKKCKSLGCGNILTRVLNPDEIEIMEKNYNSIQVGVEGRNKVTYDRRLARKAAGNRQCKKLTEQELQNSTVEEYEIFCPGLFGFSVISKANGYDNIDSKCVPPLSFLNHSLSILLKKPNINSIQNSSPLKVLDSGLQKFGCALACSFYFKLDYIIFDFTCIFTPCTYRMRDQRLKYPPPIIILTP